MLSTYLSYFNIAHTECAEWQGPPVVYEPRRDVTDAVIKGRPHALRCSVFFGKHVLLFLHVHVLVNVQKSILIVIVDTRIRITYKCMTYVELGKRRVASLCVY